MADKQIIPIVFASNENYAPYMSVAIRSIIEHKSPDKEYRVYVLHSGLRRETLALLQKMTVEGLCVQAVDITERVKDCPLYVCSYFTEEMYYRIWIPEIFKEYEKVLYLDCDVLAQADVAEMFMEDMEGNYIGACSDVHTFEMQSYIRDKLRCPEEGYFNSGVLMFNIPLWIKENLVEKCVKKIADMPDLSYPDQDVLNMVCAGKVYYFDVMWNAMWHVELGKTAFYSEVNTQKYAALESGRINPKIIHYSSPVKPWNDGRFRRLASAWRRCAQHSPFFAGKNQERWGIYLVNQWLAREAEDAAKYGEFFYCLYRLPAVFRIIKSTHSRKLKLFNVLTVYKIKYKKDGVEHCLFGFIPLFGIRKIA